MRIHSIATITIMGLLFVLLNSLVTFSASADTQITNDIAVDTRWNLTGSPYIVHNSISVLAGTTLTIDPGVEVRFEYATGITVYGTFISEGTASQNILLTGSAKTPGLWQGISIIGSGSTPNTGSSITYTIIEYGGSYHANVYVNYGVVRIGDSTIQHSAGDGVYGIFSGVIHMQDVSFTENSGYAINFYDGSIDPNLNNLSATGNGNDSVGMYSGILHGRHIWENPAIPYEIYGSFEVPMDGKLEIEPGVVIRFKNQSTLDILGKMTAIGSAAQRIHFTATNPIPGWWAGISVWGDDSQKNQLVLDYVDVEYGGAYYANIFVQESQVTISNSRIRHSSGDGIYLWYGGASSLIHSSAIAENQGHGIQNIHGVDPSHQLLAANNWWGAASGPYHATCNPSGLGNSVSDSVVYSPFLTTANQDPGTLATSDAHILEITPQRWFVPADGISEVLVKISLKNSAGFPLPGRLVNLHSTLGTVTDGLQTDFRGETAAHIISGTAGDAELTAILDYTQNCENARSPLATITFTELASGNELVADAQAPYMDGQIEFDPEPITRGQPTTVSATLNNPNNFPITVDATLSTGDFGIGQTFSELATFENHSISANSSSRISHTWTPVVSGHYCARMRYSAAGEEGWNSIGDSYQNLDVAAGALGSGGEKRALDLAEKYTGMLNHDGVTLGLNATSLYNIPYQMIHSKLIGAGLNWMFSSARMISRALGGDPPRLDYDVFIIPGKPGFPLANTDDGLSRDRVEAINALTDAMLDAIYNGRGAIISLDRYGGASSARDMVWASRQADALLYYKQRLGEKLITTSERLDELLEVAQREGFSDEVLTLDQVIAYQQLLTTQGYDSDELSAAHNLGFTELEIQGVLQEQIDADPEAVTLSRVTYIQQLVQAYLDLGKLLATESSVARGTLRASADDSNLLRTYENTQTFVLSNPLAATAKVELKIRRLDMPSEWVISVLPEQITLAPGEETRGTIKVNATTPWVKGSHPRVAIEGYVGTELIGGVVMDILIPEGGLVGCSGQKVLIPDDTLFPGGTTECTASDSISTGARVTIPDNSIVMFRTPTVSLSPGFSAGPGSVFSVLHN